jgi:hypothetical protein
VDHPEMLKDKANPGVNYRTAGRLVEGIALLEELYLKGRDQPAFSWFENDLLGMYIQAGKSTVAPTSQRKGWASSARKRRQTDWN